MIYLMKGKPEIFNHLSPSVPEPVSPHRSPINSHKVYDLPKKNVVQPKAQPRYLNTMDHLSYIILTHRHVCESSDLFACHPFPPSPPPPLPYTHTHTHARTHSKNKKDWCADWVLLWLGCCYIYWNLISIPTRTDRQPSGRAPSTSQALK